MSELERGVNLIGDLKVDAGLGEAARLITDTLLRQNIPVTHVDMRYRFKRTAKGLEDRYENLPQDARYPVNLLLYNFTHMYEIPLDRFKQVTRGRYTIGYWFWELEKIPENFYPSFAEVDEVWVATRFCQQAMLPLALGPVNIIPLPIELTLSPTVKRSAFGLPEDRYIFLFTFSQMSGDGRKNPWAVIDAFQKAFGNPGDKGPLLVIKAHQPDMFPDLYRDLHAAVRKVGGILLSESYSRQGINDLLACADVYVSLHRAEGFGLGIAEAMYLGKPVIATNYSGNVDFTRPEHSYLVDYRLIPVTMEQLRYHPALARYYQPGLLWAEADIEQAAHWMRHLYENPDEGRQYGQRAAEFMRRYYNHAVTGQLIDNRLRQISDEQARFNRRSTVLIGQLQAQHSEVLRRWDETRKSEWLSPIARIPVLGYLWRTLKRIRLLGVMAERESDVHRTAFQQSQLSTKLFQLIDHDFHDLQQQLTDLRVDYDRRLTTMQQELEQLRAQLAAQTESEDFSIKS